MYKAFDKFITRSPFFAFNTLDSVINEKDLMKLFSDGKIKEAIYIASPELYDELEKFAKNDNARLKEKQRLLNTLYKYISRMCTRSTPFGLFAGCFIGNITEEPTNITKDEGIIRKTRLDMFFLCELYYHLSKVPEIRYGIKYYPNTTLYKLNEQYRFVECKYNNGIRKHIVSAIEDNEYIDCILKKAENGVSVNELLKYLKDEDIDKESAQSFIDELIDSQVLISEIAPTITGEDYLKRLLCILSKFRNNTIISKFFKIQSLLQKLDSSSQGKEDIYRDILKEVKETEIHFERKYLFHIDFLHKIKKPNINRSIATELESTLRFLNKINQSRENNNLVSFKKEFYHRYEEQMVPLLEALDPEIGINYPLDSKKWDNSPLIDDINFLSDSKNQEKHYNWNSYQDILIDKYISSIINNEKEIILTDNDIKKLEYSNEGLPLTISTLFEFIEKEEGFSIRLKSCSGFTGASLLSRFSHLHPDIENLILKITKKEQELSGNEVLLEIVHLPHSRVGNISGRPHLRDYELLYMTNSNLNKEMVILVSDLMLSCPGGKKLVLYSPKLKKRVIPMLTNAHNFTLPTSTPLYRFLCDMQMQSGKFLSFNWGLLDNKPFLPRVKYGKTILSPMKWNINTETLKSCLSITENSILYSIVDEWRQTNGLPKYVVLPIGDNELFIDFENVLSIRSFLTEIKDKKRIMLFEFLFDVNKAIIREQTNVFTNECLMFFYKNME